MGFLKNSSGLILKDTEGRLLYLGSLEKLATPTEVSVTSTTAQWKGVSNATSYEFFVDGESIGTYTPST